MSVPALRRPKLKEIAQEKQKVPIEVEYVIITLKSEKKLVVSSDSYHGILTQGDMYKCVFCRRQLELDFSFKEEHKNSADHRRTLELYPHMKEFSENLMRKLNESTFYCTICNVEVSAAFRMRHIASDVHSQELRKAETRADIYQPFR